MDTNTLIKNDRLTNSGAGWHAGCYDIIKIDTGYRLDMCYNDTEKSFFIEKSELENFFNEYDVNDVTIFNMLDHAFNIK